MGSIEGRFQKRAFVLLIYPNAFKKDGFLDDPDSHYGNEKTFTWFIENAPNAQSIEPTSASNDFFELYTFPSDKPDRRLDHIYVIGSTLSMTAFRVVKEAGLASDHLPVMARIRYK